MVSAVMDVVAALLGTEGIDCFAEEVPQAVDGALFGRADQLFEFGEGLFDGVEVRTIGRQVTQFGTSGFDGPSYVNAMVRRQIIHDDHVAGLQRRYELLLHISHEHIAIHGAVDDRRRRQSRGAQGGDEGGSLPMTMWHRIDQPFADGTASITTRHVGAGPRFVDENDFFGIELGLLVLPRRAAFLNVGTVLFGGPKDFFLKL